MADAPGRLLLRIPIRSYERGIHTVNTLFIIVTNSYKEL